MVLRYSYSDTKVLFTGDITAEEEQQLLEQVFRRILLKVAHHGSKIQLGCRFFWKKVSPKAAVISCPVRTMYGHPHKGSHGTSAKTGGVKFSYG